MQTALKTSLIALAGISLSACSTLSWPGKSAPVEEEAAKVETDVTKVVEAVEEAEATEVTETVEAPITESAPETATTTTAPSDYVDYSSAFARDDRPEADYEQHGQRRMRSVIGFVAPRPGMTIIDMEAGHGVYTELYSKIVGAEGAVHMQNPPLFDNFAGDAIKARVAGGRLPNVEQMRTAFDDLPVEDGSADIVTWFLGPHELWFTPDGAPEGVLGDPDKAFIEIARVLKTGGTFVALDHAAASGAPATTGGDTHRIDPAIVRAAAESAGLRFYSSTTLLANAEDDYAKNVFDPEVRRKTDRFLFKFVKE